jgi:hypothetical protein
MKVSKGSKLRRSRTVDPSHKGRWIYTWISISGFHRLKSRKLATGTTKSQSAKSQRLKGCVGHRGVSEWTGGALSTRIQFS